METSEQLTALDRRILGALQENVLLGPAELAERTGSSPASCWRRVKALLRERHGIYMVGSGRIDVAGLSEANIGRFAAALTPLLHGCSKPLREPDSRYRWKRGALPPQSIRP